MEIKPSHNFERQNYQALFETYCPMFDQQELATAFEVRGIQARLFGIRINKGQMMGADKGKKAIENAVRELATRVFDYFAYNLVLPDGLEYKDGCLPTYLYDRNRQVPHAALKDFDRKTLLWLPCEFVPLPNGDAVVRIVLNVEGHVDAPDIFSPHLPQSPLGTGNGTNSAPFRDRVYKSASAQFSNPKEMGSQITDVVASTYQEVLKEFPSAIFYNVNHQITWIPNSSLASPVDYVISVSAVYEV